jgi:RNA polymerase sigma-70 factor (ECF subfamily)
MEDLADLRLEQLTNELAWMRRLAFALVRDPDLADDISHDAWLAARERIPDDRPLRPWLSRVVLNVVRMRSRTDSRRTLRELAVPPAAATPTAAELVDRVEIQRVLVEAVLALAEPYRSTVLLHYFEGLSSAEIARRTGVPNGTVRRRLKEALDELRMHFTKRDRRGVLVLAPLVGASPPSPLPIVVTVGGLTMKKLIAGIVMLIALVLLGSFLWRRGRDPAASSQAPAPSSSRAGSGKLGAHERLPTVAIKDAPWITQRGVAARRIAGHVTLDGKPVAAAIVRLGNVTTEAGTIAGDELASVKTGPDGAFDFGVQPAGVFLVSAEAVDTTPGSITITSADPKAKPDDIKLKLSTCRSRLHGTIVDSSAGGVANARLSVAGLGGTVADSGGEYSLCVPMGDSRVRIVADGYGALDLPIHLVGTLRRDFELVPESALAGTVVDESGNGVPYARVLAVPQAVEQPHFLGTGSTVADGEGRFRLTNLAPGRFLLAATAEGVGTSGPKSAVAIPGSSTEITLTVTQRAQISGRVVMKGQPVAGARVLVPSPRLLVRASFSQSDGSFVLDDVPYGATSLVAGDYEVVSPKQLVIDKPTIDGVVVEVTDGASLVGRVLRHGKPVADVLVQTTTGAQARSESSGHYELRGLPPGDLQVTAQVFGSVNAFSPFTKVKIVAGTQTEHDIDLVGGAEVRGVVVDESGAPVPNVYVRLIDPKGDLGESMTDAKGAFVCTSMLGRGAYRAAVFPSPGARTAFPPASGSHYPAFSLADGNTVLDDVKIAIKHERLAIAGRVVDETGQPVADVHVEAFGKGPGGNPGMAPSVRADVSGSFVINDLARGTYFLHARAGDGSEVELADVAAGSKGVELRLVRPGSIEGDLVGFTSIPRVHARQIAGQVQIANEAIVEGTHFAITGLSPGKYILEALAGEQNAGVSVVVKAGQITKAKLESKGQGNVQGVVLEFGTSTGVKGMNCFAAQSMGGQAGDIPPQQQPTAANATDEKGAFKIPAPIGKARVMCFSPDGSFSVAGGDADIPANAPGTINLKAVRASPPPCDPGFRIKPFTLPLVIWQVDPDGPAKAGGLAVGDRVMTIDGASVAGLLPGAAMMLARNHRPGTTITLGVERNGAPQTIKVVVAAQQN